MMNTAKIAFFGLNQPPPFKFSFRRTRNRIFGFRAFILDRKARKNNRKTEAKLRQLFHCL